MAAVARFLEKAEGKRNDDELRDLYRQYVGDYELLRNMTVEEAIGYAHDQWAEGQRVQKLEMLAELLYAEGSYKQQAVAAMPVSSKQQKKNTAGEQSEDMQKSVLEEKLEAFLENTEGVGKVQVILMTDEKKDRQSFYNSETIQVTGVLISAEGGGNPVVVQNIQEAVMALFQVDAHRIRIMKMK